MKKTILLTGASGNLGKTVLNELLEAGYHVLAPVRLDRDAKEISRHDVDATSLDLADEQQVRAYVQKESQSRNIVAAVLLAGGFEAGGLGTASIQSIKNMIHINFDTIFHVVQELLPVFKGRGMGRFIFVGSRAALDPVEGTQNAAYALSKGLVLQLAELVNAHGRGNNIDASVIVPSVIDTAANRAAMPNADFSKMVAKEAIAHSIVYMLSEAGLQTRGTVLKLYNQS